MAGFVQNWVKATQHCLECMVPSQNIVVQCPRNMVVVTYFL